MSVDADHPDLPQRDTYTVLIRGVEFMLSRAQITFDSPNLFTTSFLGDFSEANTRTLMLDSDPELFELIVDYLSGYPILPLDKDELPRRMTTAKAIRYLAKDANYLGLSKLQGILSISVDKYTACYQLSAQRVSLLDVLKNALPAGMKWHDKTLVDETGMPVVVYGKDVSIRFQRGCDMQVGGIPTSQTLYCCIRELLASSTADATAIYGSLAGDGLLQLNGATPVFGSEASRQIHKFSEQGMPNYYTRSNLMNVFPWWADELWCTIDQRTFNDGVENGRDGFLITLLGMKARTRASVVLQNDFFANT